MKKVFIASVIILVSSVNYKAYSNNANNRFYIVADLGLVINSSKLPESTKDKMRDIRPRGLKIKSNHGFIGDIGLGYRCNNDIRFDFKVGLDKSDYEYKPDIEKDLYSVSLTPTRNDIKEEDVQSYGKVIKIKSRSLDFSLNGYYDFETLYKGIKPFISAGIGVSNQKLTTNTNQNILKERVKYKKETETKDTSQYSYTNTTGTSKYKNKLNPFYSIGIGVAFTHKDTPNTSIDLSYKFKKNLKNSYKDNDQNNYKIKSHSHYFTLGIRYNF